MFQKKIKEYVLIGVYRDTSFPPWVLQDPDVKRDRAPLQKEGQKEVGKHKVLWKEASIFYSAMTDKHSLKEYLIYLSKKLWFRNKYSC